MNMFEAARAPLLLSVLAAGLLLATTVHAAHDQQSAKADGARTAVVQTASGPIRGTRSHSMREFLGVPFAAPPVGDLRWRPPQPATAWTDTRDATQFGNTCPQTNTLITFAAKSSTEDCLYLNVFTPADASQDKRPVMVWVHGGGLVDGESDDYDPRKLVTQGDVIVVTVNYRLNALGFFALPTLDKEDHALANYGLMDQQFALKWVKRNIAAFGGDPDNVTLFGESAGALSVLANLASPSAKGLFQRAIVESPARGQKLRLDQPDLKAAQARGVALAKAVGCADLQISCLRSKSVADLQSATGDYDTSLIVDGNVLDRSLGAALNGGEFNHMPVLIGANKDEGRFSIAYKELTGDKALTKQAYTDALESAHGDHMEAVRKHYPLARYNSPSTAMAAIMTDGRIVCPVRRLDDRLARFVPTFAYLFADRTAPFYFPPVSFPYGAAHTAELQYLFAGYHGATGNEHPLNAQQSGLSDQLVRYWTTFAHDGDPNTDGAPHWPAYKANDGRFQLLKLPAPMSISRDDYDLTHHCGMWANAQ